MRNLKLPFNLACLALIQLDQADYTVVWDTPHPYFYSFPCYHLQFLFIFLYVQMFQIKQDPSIPEIQLFRDLTLKIQGQSDGWDQRWRSYWGSNFVSIHMPFISCQAGNPFLRYNSWKIWPWKSKIKVIGRSKLKVRSLSFLANRTPCSWDAAIPKFDLENPMSRSPCGHCNNKFGESVHNPC